MHCLGYLVLLLQYFHASFLVYSANFSYHTTLNEHSSLKIIGLGSLLLTTSSFVNLLPSGIYREAHVSRLIFSLHSRCNHLQRRVNLFTRQSGIQKHRNSTMVPLIKIAFVIYATVTQQFTYKTVFEVYFSAITPGCNLLISFIRSLLDVFSPYTVPCGIVSPLLPIPIIVQCLKFTFSSLVHDYYGLLFPRLLPIPSLSVVLIFPFRHLPFLVFLNRILPSNSTSYLFTSSWLQFSSVNCFRVSSSNLMFTLVSLVSSFSLLL